MEINSIDCPKCGGNISEQITRGKPFKCLHCGSTLVWPGSQATFVLNFGAWLCPQCGIDNDQNRDFCRNCGTALTKKCYICNKVLYVGDNFCPNGHNYELEKQKAEATSNVIIHRKPAFSGGTVKMMIIVDGSKIGELEQNERISFPLSVGDHTIKAGPKSSSGISAGLSGETSIKIMPARVYQIDLSFSLAGVKFASLVFVKKNKTT
jgi:hypothetical protein